jgi:hypothetical protein
MECAQKEVPLAQREGRMIRMQIGGFGPNVTICADIIAPPEQSLELSPRDPATFGWRSLAPTRLAAKRVLVAEWR